MSQFEDFPFINLGQFTHINLIDPTEILPLPSHSSFGNLTLKYLKLMEKLLYINTKTQDIIADHIDITDEKQLLPSNLFKISAYLLKIEELIFLLRRVADELISLTWLLSEWANNKKPPTKLVVDCIGSLLAKKNKEFSEKYFDKHINFLRKLNKISNAHKHSFIYSDINLIGKDEPTVNALELPNNDLCNIDINQIKKNLHEIYLRDVIKGFDMFFLDVKKTIMTLNNRVNNLNIQNNSS